MGRYMQQFFPRGRRKRTPLLVCSKLPIHSRAGSCIRENEVPSQNASERFDSDRHWWRVEVRRQAARLSSYRELLSEEDRSILNKELASKTDGMEFFHQLGILVQYLKQAPEKSKHASLYRQLPCVSHCYAFERGNLYKDIFTQTGRQEWLPLSTMFVVKSFLNDWNENKREYIESLADDKSFHVLARTRSKEKRKSSNVDAYTSG